LEGIKMDYATVNTRTLQDILRAEQIRLETTKHYLQRGVVKNRIRVVARELLYRWRSEKT
jgi:hypothetical protein